MRWRVRSLPRKWDSVSSGGGGSSLPSVRANGSRERAPDDRLRKTPATTRLSSPGLTGRSSTPRLLGLSPAPLEYWVARSSRAMTAVIVSSVRAGPQRRCRTRNDGLSRRGGERLAGVGANPLDHGAQSVGALRRQMLAKSELVEHRDGVGGKNFPRGVAGIQRQEDRDQSAHDVGVAVAKIVQQRFVAIAAVDLLCQPDL